MLNVERLNQFKRDYKKQQKRHKKMDKLHTIIKLLAQEKTLPSKYHDHTLTRNWAHHRELHIEPDWLLIYKLLPKENTLLLVRTGSHSDLF